MGKFVRPIGKRAETSDMTPQLVEEYVLETAERGQARVYHTRLTILQVTYCSTVDGLHYARFCTLTVPLLY